MSAEKPKKKGFLGLGRRLHGHSHHHDGASVKSGVSKAASGAEPATPGTTKAASPSAEESVEHTPFSSAIPHSPGSPTYKKTAGAANGSIGAVVAAGDGAGEPFPQKQASPEAVQRASSSSGAAALSRGASKVSRASTPGLDGEEDADEDAEPEPEPDLSGGAEQLVCVLLHEGSVDTPAFRASVNYIDVQFKELQVWLAGLTAKSASHAAHMNAIKDSINGVIEQFMPPFTNNSILLQDYTTLLFSKFATSESTFWAELIAQVQQGNDALQAAVKRLTQGVLSRYTKARASYVQALTDHEQQRKTVFRMPFDAEPAALRDAAHRSHNLNRTLAKSATALVLAISDVESETSLTLMDTLSAQALGRHSVAGHGLSRDRAEVIVEMHRIRSLSARLRAGFPSISSDLRSLRSSLLQKTRGSAPPKELAAYHADAAPPVEPDLPHKFGWVLMSFETGVPAPAADSHHHHSSASASAGAGQVWEQRWAFVQNGVFGGLALDSTNTKVIETAKLATTNLEIEEVASTETHAHVLKLRVDSYVVHIQTETRSDRARWLTALKNSRDAHTPAPTVIPPWSPAFATPEAVDMASKALGTSPITTRTREVSSDTNRPDWLRPDSTLTSEGATVPVHTVPSVKPLPTAHMYEALVANWFMRPQGMPNAITSNFWGVVNWQHSSTEAQFSQGFPVYPDNYPRRLIVQDGDMRSVVTQLPVNQQPAIDDLLQFIVRGTTVIHKREIPTRMYVTSRLLIIYSSWRGLVNVQSIDLSRIVDIEARHGIDFSDLRLAVQSDGGSGASHMLDFRLYVDSTALMKRKLSLIIENMRSRHPMTSRELFEHLALVNLEYSEMLRREESQKQAQFVRPGKGTESHGLAAFLLEKPVGGGSARGEEETLQIGKGMQTKVSEDTFPVPAEALYLTMFGSRSPVFSGDFTGVVHGTSKAGPWYRRGRFTERRVVQHANVLGSDDPNMKQEMFHYQRIEQAKADFYVITERRSAWEMPHGDQFYLVFKYCIYASEQGSHIQVWSKTVWTKKSTSEHTSDNTVTEFARMGIRTVMLRTRKAASLVSNTKEALHRYGSTRATKILEGKESRELEQTVTRVTARSFFSLMTQLPLTAFLGSIKWLVTTTIEWVLALSSPLLFLLVTSFVSLFLNTVFYRRSSVAYWSAHIQEQDNKHFVETATLLPEKGTVFRRGIYMQDLNDAISNGVVWGADGINHGIGPSDNSSSSLCSARFGEIAQLAWSDEFGKLYEYEPSVLRTLSRIAEVRQNFALRRTDLLARLRLLNASEREQLMHEYRKWLVSETTMCSLVRPELPKLETAVIHGIREYCLSCLEEAKGLL